MIKPIIYIIFAVLEIIIVLFMLLIFIIFAIDLLKLYDPIEAYIFSKYKRGKPLLSVSFLIWKTMNNKLN